jgi:hypothetical protein
MRIKRWNKMTDSRAKNPGMQRRFKGKTVLPNGSPRAHTHGGHSQANAGFTSHDAPPETMRGTAGRFKVQTPTKAWQRSGIVRNDTTGEPVNA